MALTQGCIQKYSTYFACKISKLSLRYYQTLQIGSSCSETYLFQLQLATALLEQICDIDLTTETCLDEDQICDIIDNLKIIVDKYKCGCNGN